MAARQLAQHQRGGVHADILGPHDLVGLDVLQHAVLVDAAFMREGVLADDGLVVLHREAGDVDETSLEARVSMSVLIASVVKGIESLRTFSAITISSSAALPARSPMPLMVHSTWRAPAMHAGQRIGDREAQIVVAVGGEDHLVGIRARARCSMRISVDVFLRRANSRPCRAC